MSFAGFKLLRYSSERLDGFFNAKCFGSLNLSWFLSLLRMLSFSACSGDFFVESVGFSMVFELHYKSSVKTDSNPHEDINMKFLVVHI